MTFQQFHHQIVLNWIAEQFRDFHVIYLSDLLNTNETPWTGILNKSEVAQSPIETGCSDF